jgi:hypothetical protein
MSRNGSGTYNLPAGNPVVSGTTITTTWANTTLNDIAASLTGSVAADGQTPMTGALNMATNKITNLVDGTVSTDAATLGQVNTVVAGYQTIITATGILKGAGAGSVSAGTAGTDYTAPTAVTNFSKQQYFGNVALTDASTIAWNARDAQVATFTFVSSNRTMDAPTNLVSGAFYGLAIIQNAGSNTLTWNSVFKWASGTAPTLSTAAGAKDYFVFRSDGTNMYEQGRSLGVS